MWYQTETRGRLRRLRDRVARASLRTVCIVAIAVSAVAARADIGVGDVFPSLSSAGLTIAGVPALAGRVVLIDFWASWCAPCKASFPSYARLHADYAAREFVIVAVSVDESAAAYASFIKKLQPPFVVVRDEEQKLAKAVNVPAMPTSYLLGRDGRVRFVHQGFHGAATETELRQNIDSLLAEKS